MHFFKDVLLIWVYKRRNKNDRLKLRIDMMNILFIKTSQIAWLGYAHTFHYGEAGQECRYFTKESRMWDLQMACMVLSYLACIHLIIICIALICLLSKQKNKVENERPHELHYEM